jgi:superfamily II DNA or RNA helicase
MMGFLTAKMSAQVDRIYQERGRRYFLRGAVEILEADAWRVEANVQGTRRYRVSIARTNNVLHVSCTCPYYERALETCKHIWATFLAAEQEGRLQGAGEISSLEIDEKIAAIPNQRPDRPPRAKNYSAPSWQQQLESLRGAMETREVKSSQGPERELVYLIDVEDTLASHRLAIEVAQRERKMDGNWGKLKSRRIRFQEIANSSDPLDRQILAILFGATDGMRYHYSSNYYDSAPPTYVLALPLWDVALPLICGSGRCFLRLSFNDAALKPLCWDGGDPWELWLKATRDPTGKRYSVNGVLRRKEIEMELTKPALLLAGGLVFSDGLVSSLQDFGAFGWISLLRERGSLSIPKEEADDFLSEVLRLPRRPKLELPEELHFEIVSQRPRPCLIVKPGEDSSWRPQRLIGELSFEYDGKIVPHHPGGQDIYQKERRRLVLRDVDAEAAAAKRLKLLGFRKSYWPAAGDGELEIAPNHLAKAARALTDEGWRVEAEGKLYRTPGEVRIEISSGIDWFEIHGAAEFGETKVPFPKLLLALKRGEHAVRLDDGTLGIIPEEWLKKYGLLAGLGSFEKDRLRFARQQAGLLDALLAAEPGVTADRVFERVREELHSFAGVKAADAPADFTGTLRDYQREGLGWLGFLQRFGFGGCLADDMGLGKTIQVLALLESRRELRAGGLEKTEAKSSLPSLVVVPRSLVFHWKSEAARFAPRLRLLDHTGVARRKPGRHFNEHDVVITTYGTLRRDAVQLKNLRFDYCILDEAQAIKNAGSLSAKAARLLGADHRLALSGTPVENHLGELWSLFEFLNPGMLGAASIFGRAGRNPDAATRSLLARALRPFILRRTKGEVARELPPKTEQTIYCDLEGTEKKRYEELRAYYRSRVLKNVDREGISRAKFQALEALLRLRQAACHPGLIDKSKSAEPSAKIDTLLSQLDQVLDEGHKALVFSQFTSLLAIVRSRLDRANIPYAYLDGRTRDRQARVEQFQSDPNVKLFLISLKAGGLGLNLHAAEYVYILDPWWNPAVEAQAIDRAHRIGQTRHVFAYRLIARDTVEEKVLELQQTKRDLADAIITADNSLIHDLTREDLELLLS